MQCYFFKIMNTLPVTCGRVVLNQLQSERLIKERLED